jgi:hypothetical protein
VINPSLSYFLDNTGLSFAWECLKVDQWMLMMKKFWATRGGGKLAEKFHALGW